MEMIKKELGSEAVILKSGKIMDSSRNPLFEVQAAIDEEGCHAFARNEKTTLKQEPQLKNIESKIEEITNFLSMLVSTKEHFLKINHHRDFSKVYNYLIMQELDEKKAYLLLSKVAKSITGEVDSAKIISLLCKELISTIKTVEPFKNILDKASSQLPPMYTFLGPTGSGKTTTLAKLAAMLKVEKNLSVGIINLDNYRIGATDQLKTYAQILELPFITAQSKEELEFARKQLKDCHLIFIDTTGKNFLNQQPILELLSIFEDMKNLRHFLVLSSTTKDKDLMKTIQQFEPLGIYSLIFTKIDETSSHGNVINQLLRFPYPVSYFGTGQKIPEDIKEASKKDIINLLFPRR